MRVSVLRDGDFSSLTTAVEDWGKVVSSLKTIGDDARDNLKAKSDKARWAGVNSQVSREFVDKTVGEFADALTEATSIHNVLRDTYDELVHYQRQLQTAMTNGLRKNLTVVDTGEGSFTVTMNIHPDRAAAGTTVPEHTQQDVDSLRDEVQRILTGATESDSSAAEILRALVDEAKYGFAGGEIYEDRDAAAKPIEDAEHYAKLMKEKGDDMTPAQLADLNATLEKYRDDPLFQERFATVLGPRGVLDFWMDLSDPSDGGDLQHAPRDQFGDLQRNISLTLAGATQSDSPAMQTWQNDVIALGDERIKVRGSAAYGFQIMSNFMRAGDYDNTFLNKYGNALVATEKEMRLPDHYWQGTTGAQVPKLNFLGGDDFGRDPMTGFMTGLSHSPIASTEFFNTTEPQDNAEWVLKERPWLDDTPLDDGDTNQGREATGKALVAAATGVDPGDPNARPVEHNAAQRGVVDRSLGYLSDLGDDFPSEYRDDMAKVLVNWGDETHNSMSAQADHTDPRDPKYDPRQFDRGDLFEVAKQISRDQSAYGDLNSGLNTEMVKDINNGHPQDPKETLQRAGATVGFLEEARYQALDTDKEDPSWDAKWLYHGFGGAANFIPVAGDAVQRGVDALAYQWQLDEQARIDAGNHEQNGEVFRGRENQLEALAGIWAEANPDHGQSPYTLTQDINGAAFDGNGRARGLSGDQ